MTTHSKREIAERRQAVANAVATQRLEGLDIDAITRAEMERYAQGEIEIADILESVRRRAVAGDFREEAAKRPGR